MTTGRQWWRRAERATERDLAARFAEAMKQPHRIQVLPPTDMQRLAGAVDRLAEQVAGLRADVERWMGAEQ